MAMNGRQKAMTGALMGASRQAESNPMLGIDPLEALKMMVREIEAGNIAIKNLSMETFRNPRSFATVDRDFQSIVPGDCFATVQFEIAPSGRVRDTYAPRGVNVRVNGLDTGMTREQYDAVARELEGEPSNRDMLDPNDDILSRPLNEYGEVDLASPSRAADRAQDKREAEAKPATPTGASAAREVIFDDGDVV